MIRITMSEEDLLEDFEQAATDLFLAQREEDGTLDRWVDTRLVLTKIEETDFMVDGRPMYEFEFRMDYSARTDI
jgi:hypothetical protein